MRHIYIVRHGERMDNVDPNWKEKAPRGAWDDPPLSSRGHQQAREVGRKLASEHVKIDHVFSSPFLRCVQTTDEILRELHGIEETKSDGDLLKADIQEKKLTKQLLKIRLEPGICEALTLCQTPAGCLEAKDLKSTFPVIDHTYVEFITKDKLPVEKSAICCFPRVESTLKQIIENYSGNILIVSHGAPITACHAHLCGTFQYVGQCTISKYIAEEPTKNGEKIASAQEEQENLNDEKFRRIDEKELAARTHPKLEKKWTFKCEYVGDSSHLSDQSELRGLSDCSEKQINDFKALFTEYSGK